MFLSDHSTNQFKHIKDKIIDVYSTNKGWQKEFEFSYLIKFMGARNKIYKQEKEREI